MTIIKTSSRPTAELSRKQLTESNQEVFDSLLATLRPDLYLLEAYRRELQVVNIDFLRRVLKSVFNIVAGSGWGTTSIRIQGSKITKIETSEGELIREKEQDLFEGRR